MPTSTTYVDDADVEHVEICLSNVDGDVFALGARCAHRGGPICKGDRNDDVVTCPWHGWEYDVETGDTWCRGCTLPLVSRHIEDETVYLEIESLD